jgi:hypothetical protein
MFNVQLRDQVYAWIAEGEPVEENVLVMYEEDWDEFSWDEDHSIGDWDDIQPRDKSEDF